MHTTQSYAVFPSSVFSREHWFIIWTTFSIKAAKTKSSKEECGKKQINSLLQKSEHFTRNGSLNLRTKDILTNDLLLLELFKPKVIWAGECPATATERTGNWIQLKMSLGSPVKTQPNHSCQMRWRSSEHREHRWYEERAAEFMVESLPQIFTPYRAKPSLLVPLRCYPNLWKSLCYVRDPQIALLLPWLQIWLTGEQQL